jgi:tRNA uridine 5-carbamoylmethylation protein Kti12
MTVPRRNKSYSSTDELLVASKSRIYTNYCIIILIHFPYIERVRFNTNIPSNFKVEMLALLLRVYEVPRLNLCPETGFHD